MLASLYCGAPSQLRCVPRLVADRRSCRRTPSRLTAGLGNSSGAPTTTSTAACSQGDEDAAAVYIGVGIRDATLQLLTEFRVPSGVRSDLVPPHTERLLRLVMLVKYHKWAQHVFRRYALWYNTLVRYETKRDFLTPKAMQAVLATQRPFEGLTLLALVEIAESVLGPLAIVEAFIGQDGLGTREVVVEFCRRNSLHRKILVERMSSHPPLRDYASAIDQAAKNGSKLPPTADPTAEAKATKIMIDDVSTMHRIRSNLAFRTVHAVWDAHIEGGLLGLSLDSPISLPVDLRDPAYPGFACAAALPARLEKELWAELAAPGDYTAFLGTIWSDRGASAIGKAYKTQALEELLPWMRKHGLALADARHVARWTLTLTEQAEESISSAVLDRLAEAHAKKASSAPLSPSAEPGAATAHVGAATADASPASAPSEAGEAAPLADAAPGAAVSDGGGAAEAAPSERESLAALGREAVSFDGLAAELQTPPEQERPGNGATPGPPTNAAAAEASDAGTTAGWSDQDAAGTSVRLDASAALLDAFAPPTAAADDVSPPAAGAETTARTDDEARPADTACPPSSAPGDAACEQSAEQPAAEPSAAEPSEVAGASATTNTPAPSAAAAAAQLAQLSTQLSAAAAQSREASPLDSAAADTSSSSTEARGDLTPSKDLAAANSPLRMSELESMRASVRGAEAAVADARSLRDASAAPAAGPVGAAASQPASNDAPAAPPSGSATAESRGASAAESASGDEEAAPAGGAVRGDLFDARRTAARRRDGAGAGAARTKAASAEADLDRKLRREALEALAARAKRYWREEDRVAQERAAEEQRQRLLTPTVESPPFAPLSRTRPLQPASFKVIDWFEQKLETRGDHDVRPTAGGAKLVARDLLTVHGSSADELSDIHASLLLDARNSFGLSQDERTRLWTPNPDAPRKSDGATPVFSVRYSADAKQHEVKVKRPDGTTTDVTLSREAVRNALALLDQTIPRMHGSAAKGRSVRGPGPLSAPRVPPKEAKPLAAASLWTNVHTALSGAFTAVVGACEAALTAAAGVVPSMMRFFARTVLPAVASVLFACFLIHRGGGLAPLVDRPPAAVAYQAGAAGDAAAARTGAASVAPAQEVATTAEHATQRPPAAGSAAPSTSGRTEAAATMAPRLLEDQGRLSLQEELRLATQLRQSLDGNIALPDYWSADEARPLAMGDANGMRDVAFVRMEPRPLVYNVVVTADGKVVGVQPMNTVSRARILYMPFTDDLFAPDQAASVKEFRREVERKLLYDSEAPPPSRVRFGLRAAQRELPERFGLLEVVVSHGEDRRETLPAKKIGSVTVWEERDVVLPTFSVRVTPLEAEASLVAHWADVSADGRDLYGAHAVTDATDRWRSRTVLRHGAAFQMREHYRVGGGGVDSMQYLQTRLADARACYEDLYRQATRGGASDADVITLCDALNHVAAWQEIYEYVGNSGPWQANLLPESVGGGLPSVGDVDGEALKDKAREYFESLRKGLSSDEL